MSRDELLKTAREAGVSLCAYPTATAVEDFYVALGRFYTLAKADALREAAAECVDIIDRTLLRNKAEELEKQT